MAAHLLSAGGGFACITVSENYSLKQPSVSGRGGERVHRHDRRTQYIAKLRTLRGPRLQHHALARSRCSVIGTGFDSVALERANSRANSIASSFQPKLASDRETPLSQTCHRVSSRC